jgi:hypothetical protein
VAIFLKSKLNLFPCSYFYRAKKFLMEIRQGPV